MIPSRAVDAWREFAPWIDSSQVEQDLVISRALVEIYSDDHLKKAFAFRGGTAIQKLFLNNPTRYSEDIDLVQVGKENIGPSIDKIRKILDPWLGKPSRDAKKGRVTIVYRFKTEIEPIRSMRLKIEVNTAEHFSVFPLQHKEIEVKNIWFNGKADILTYEMEELLGTKMRALYQRKKGRDLYDMSIITRKFKNLDVSKVVHCFQKYLKHQTLSVSRAQFEENLTLKLKNKTFGQDIQTLLVPGTPKFNVVKEGESFMKKYLVHLPGEPWKGLHEK